MRLDQLHVLAKAKPLPSPTALETDYITYCTQARIPSKRDYNFLRQILRRNIEQSHNFLVPYFQMIFENTLKEVKTVFDMGAGHTAWADIFREAFPWINIVLIDKDIMDPGPYTFHHQDVRKILEGNSFNSTDFLWFSEFFHCKTGNLDLLQFTNSCHIAVNELMWNKDICDRLRQTGGCLIEHMELYSIMRGDEIYYYNTPLFPYYMVTRSPK